MMTSREALYIAIFNQLSTATGFNSYWRKFMPIQQLSSPQMPALMMREVREERHSVYAQPPKYTIDIDVAIICETQSDMTGAIPASVINPLIDEIETVMLSTDVDEHVVTLGVDGVSRIWIEGAIEILETVPGSSDRTFALIPVKVICQ